VVASSAGACEVQAGAGFRSLGEDDDGAYCWQSLQNNMGWEWWALESNGFTNNDKAFCGSRCMTGTGSYPLTQSIYTVSPGVTMSIPYNGSNFCMIRVEAVADVNDPMFGGCQVDQIGPNYELKNTSQGAGNCSFTCIQDNSGQMQTEFHPVLDGNMNGAVQALGPLSSGSTDRACFLTRVLYSDGASGQDAFCHVFVDNGQWILSATEDPSPNVSCQATCVLYNDGILGPVGPIYDNPVDMIQNPDLTGKDKINFLLKNDKTESIGQVKSDGVVVTDDVSPKR
jgi:hypothetical protein